MVEVTIASGLTMAQLLLHLNNGECVMRTAHIGNQYPSNMLLMSLGIPTTLYDKNVVEKDGNYHPGVRIQNGMQIRLTDKTGLVQYSGVCHEHIPPLEHLFPGIVNTSSSWLLQHEEVYSALLDLLQRHLPQAFDRYALSCGCMQPLVTNRLCTCPDANLSFDVSLLAQGTLQLNGVFAQTAFPDRHELHGFPSAHGPVLSLPASILAEVLVGHLQSKQKRNKVEVWSLSGPDMVKYVGKPEYIKAFNDIYAVLCNYGSQFGLSFPERLALHIVPTTGFRFGYVDGNAQAAASMENLEVLLKLEEQLQAHNAVNNQKGVYEVRAQIIDVLDNNPADWEVNYSIRNGTFFTQHDLMETPSKRLQIPEWAMHVPMGKLEKLRERLRKFRK